MTRNCSRQTSPDLGQGINHRTYLHGPNPDGLAKFEIRHAHIWHYATRIGFGKLVLY